MTIARLSGLCAAVFLSTSAAFANNECANSGMDVQFKIDATNLNIDLIASVKSSSEYILDSIMSDVDSGSVGWNACFETDSDDESSVTAKYQANGTEWAVIEYSSWESSSGYPQNAKIVSMDPRMLVTYTSKTNTVAFYGP